MEKTQHNDKFIRMKPMIKMIRLLTLATFLGLGLHNLSHASASAHPDTACATCHTILHAPGLASAHVSIDLPRLNAESITSTFEVASSRHLFYAKNLRSPPAL